MELQFVKTIEKMWKSLNKSFNKLLEMFKEAGVYSINRVLPGGLIIILTVLFIGVTLYLVSSKITPSAWSGYGELCTAYMTAVGICATWLTGNKITNSKYNTDPGAPGKPLGPAEPNEKVVAVLNTVVKKTSNMGGNDR